MIVMAKLFTLWFMS